MQEIESLPSCLQQNNRSYMTIPAKEFFI